jgi:hypothetical protein
MERERNFIFNAREGVWHPRNHLTEAEVQYEGVFASSDRSADQVFSLLDADWDDPEEGASDED